MTLSTSKATWRVNRAVLRHVHQALHQRIKEIQSAADADFARRFNHLVATVESGLRHEEGILEALGDRHLRERRAENALILCALHRIAPTVEQGQVEPGRQLAAALEEMIALHRLSDVLALESCPVSYRFRGRAAGNRVRTLPRRTWHYQ